MRIIAGTKRGMKLLAPKTHKSRPITDRVKESLFSVLYKYDLPKDKFVADLFCGTGSLGLEALSREAEHVSFVERSRDVVEILRKNIEKAVFAGKSRVITTDAFKLGAPVGIGEKKYELVFVDPPYDMTKNVQADSPLGRLLVLLSQQVAEDGVVVVRTQRKTSLLARYDRLKSIDRRQWGTMAVTILRAIRC